MRRYVLWCGVVLLLLAPAHLRAEPAPKLVLDTWDAAYLEGAKTGHAHVTVHEVERDGKKVLKTSLHLNLTVKRYKSVVTLRSQVGTEETADGKVLGVSFTQYLDGGQKLVQTGRVEGNKILVQTPGDSTERALPWDPEVWGLYKQLRMFRDRKVKAGDRFTFLNYELAIQRPIKVNVEVKSHEVVDLFKVRKDGDKTRVERVRTKLLRVNTESEKVVVGGRPVPLPNLVLWLNDDREVVRQEMDLPGLGKVTLYRTTKEVALEEGVAPSLLPDLGLNTLIGLREPIKRSREADEIVYRITVSGDQEAASTFTQDERQKPENTQGSTFDLHVKAVREPESVSNPGEAKPEFLKSCYFLNCDDRRIRDMAEEIVGLEADSWKKAKAIEKWVFDHMTVNNGIAFASASQIARDLKGDCRQHAMLTAALCRAVKIPARTAVGLVYVNDRDHGPVLGFHMWTEVWIKGQWLGIDATQGDGSVGAEHLKIADHSWVGVQTLAPLLPVSRVIGRLKIEVVSVK